MISKFYSILNNRCPRCHKDNFFIHRSPFTKGFTKMHEKCKSCEQDFNLETGFYYGAMYTSYAINVVIFVLAWLFAIFVLPKDVSIWATVGVTMSIGLIMAPLTFRWSRLLWINFFVPYSGKVRSAK